MLKEIKVPIENLLLDPNNPRFKKDLTENVTIKDEFVLNLQKDVLKNFSINRPADDENDVTNISTLYESMKNIGYVPIDRIVVRPIKNSSYYLVLEGNRRIATIKKMIEDYKKCSGGLFNRIDRKKYEGVRKSFDEIICMCLEVEGLSDEDLSHKISIILGLRHHGSLLEWDALPKAYNIYKEYMNIEPRSKEYKFNASKIGDVSSRLSIDNKKVKSAIKTYMAYLQLSKNYDVKNKHYSLIESIVTNKNLNNYFIKIDDDSNKLDETSMEEMNKICQFSTRDNLPITKKKILVDPKKATLLGRLFNKRQNATHEVVKSYAVGLIHRVLDEDDLEMTIEAALDDLVSLENRIFWVDSIEKLLDKQESELKIDDYTGIGNDLGEKDELKRTIEPLKRIMGI